MTQANIEEIIDDWKSLEFGFYEKVISRMNIYFTLIYSQIICFL